MRVAVGVVKGCAGTAAPARESYTFWLGSTSGLHVMVTRVPAALDTAAPGSSGRIFGAMARGNMFVAPRIAPPGPVKINQRL